MHKGRQRPTEKVTHLMLTFLVQCISAGDVGVYLILMYAGYFDLTPLPSGTNAYISIRDSAEQETSFCMWVLKKYSVANPGAIKMTNHK